jgi:hypothetical protein
MIKTSTIIIAAIILSGCTTNQLTTSGQNVQVITEHAFNKCKSIGSVVALERSATNSKGSIHNAMTELRNKTSNMGGNAIRILDTKHTTYIKHARPPRATGQQLTMTAEALTCKLDS